MNSSRYVHGDCEFHIRFGEKDAINADRSRNQTPIVRWLEAEKHPPAQRALAWNFWKYDFANDVELLLETSKIGGVIPTGRSIVAPRQ